MLLLLKRLTKVTNRWWKAQTGIMLPPINLYEAKSTVGKLAMDALLSEAAHRLGLEALPISVAHGEFADALPLHHRDPFDRLLVAQAVVEGLVLVTADSILQKYDVDVLLV